MADVKISGLPASTVPLAGTEVLPIVQSSTTKKVSIANVTAGRAVSALSFAPTGSALPVNGLFLPDTNAVGISTNSEERARFFASGGVSIGNTVDPGATNLSVTGLASATRFVPTGSTIPTNGMYLDAANSVSIAANSLKSFTVRQGGISGLGTTPQSWYVPGDIISAQQIGANVAVFSLFSNQAIFSSNYYLKTGSGADTYINTGVAMRYRQDGGGHYWDSAPSGTADTTVTFSTKMQIAPSGGVSIGNTTDPGATNLSVNGSLFVGTTAAISAGKQTISYIGAAANGLVISESADTASTTFLAFNIGSSVIGSVVRVAATSAVVYQTTSDYRLKTVISSVADAGQRIDALEPIEYDWNTGGRTRGFLAHKFAEIYPNSVTGKKDAIDKDGNPIYQGMQAATSEVMADLIAEIQSLRKRVAQLESK